MRECARSVACTVTRASTARLIKSTPQCGRVLSVRQSAPQRTLRTGFSPTLVRRNGVCVLSPYDCSVLSFYGCAPFPALAKVRSYTLRITRLHGRGRAPLFDKISAAAFFLARRSPNENGRFPAAENLPRGKPIVTTASAVRNTISPCGRNRLLQSEAHKGFLILLAVPRSENVFDYSYLAVLLGIGMLNR